MAKQIPKTAEPSYQELTAQLEALTLKLEDPNTGIDDATGYYEQAFGLIAQLEAKLRHAENRVHEIRAHFEGLTE